MTVQAFIKYLSTLNGDAEVVLHPEDFEGEGDFVALEDVYTEALMDEPQEIEEVTEP